MVAYAPLPLFKAAAEALQGKHPLAVLGIPAMVRAGVKAVSTPDDGTEYGSLDELQTLNDYFKIPGGPPDRPFRAIWETDLTSLWRDDRYPGRALQRVRTDRVKSGEGFFQKKATAGRDLWGIRPNAGIELKEYVGDPVRIVDLAIWYGRKQDVADLDQLIGWFKSEFPIDQAGLVGTIYDEDVPAHYRDIPFAPTPLTQSDYAEAVGGAPEAAKLETSFSEFAQSLEHEVKARGFVTSPGFVERVVSAWAKGDIVVLAGQPGTGKTRFANTVSAALRKLLGDLTTVWVPVRTDFDEGDLIGYERLDGAAELRPFATRVLQTEEPLGPHLVVLEEFNLTSLETYLASVLVATEDSQRRITLPGGDEVRLPVDTLFLATCNSYLDEPETRQRLSFPSKRRAAVITMPNVVLERYEKEGRQAILELTITMVKQELGEVEERRTSGLGTTFDEARQKSLSSFANPNALSPKTAELWTSIAEALLATPEGGQFFTLSMVKDVALELAYAERTEEAELAGLGRAVADKVIHQLRGPKERADQLLAAVGDLPNRDEITRLLDRMKAGPGSELLPLV